MTAINEDTPPEVWVCVAWDAPTRRAGFICIAGSEEVASAQKGREGFTDFLVMKTMPLPISQVRSKFEWWLVDKGVLGAELHTTGERFIDQLRDAITALGDGKVLPGGTIKTPFLLGG